MWSDVSTVGAAVLLPACTGLTLALGLLLFLQNRRRAGEPPVVWSWTPVLGSAVAFGANPLRFLRTKRDEHGPVFVAVLAGERTAFVADPSLWPSVLRERKAVSFGPISSAVVEKAFGVRREAVAAMHEDGAAAKFHGIFLSGLQRADALDELTSVATKALDDALRTALDAGAEPSVPLFGTLGFPLFSATMSALLGPDFASRKCYEEFAAFDANFAYLAAGAPAAAFHASRDGLASLAARFRTSPSYAGGGKPASAVMRERKALFESLAADSPGGTWDDDAVGRCQTTMIWAAAANTIPAALWTLYYILRSPAAHAAVREELDSLLPSPRPSDFDDLPVLDACISETLRLTTASLIVRRVVAPGGFEIGGRRLRNGDRVALFPPLLHFDPETFDRAEEFDHERYLAPEKKKPKPPPPPLVPFGGGASLCPGRTFARREIKAFAALVLSRYDLALVEPSAPPPPPDRSRVGLGVVPPAPGSDVRVVATRRFPRR